MEWCPAEWSVCLPLLIFPCTINSRSPLLAPAHMGGPGKRAVKRLWWITGNDKIIYEHQPELEYCKLAQPITAANLVQYVVSHHDPTDGSTPAF